MKNIFRNILIIPIYFLLVIGNNIRLIHQNMGNGVAVTSNMSYINFNIIISLLILVISINLVSKFKNLKGMFICASIVTIICNIISGIFVGEEIASLIPLYALIIYNTFLFSVAYKEGFEISIAASTTIMIILAITLAMFNLLGILKYILLAYVVISLLIVLVKGAVNEENLKRINGSSFIIFSILFLIAIFGGINRYVHTWDEFSHWAFDAKAVIGFDKLSTCQEVMGYNRSYPPAMSIWHYIVSIFSGFNEHHLYMGLNIFVAIFMMPIFMVNKKKCITAILFVIGYGACFLFGGVYSYETLYADLPIAMVNLATFMIYLNYKDKPKLLMKHLALNMSLILLIKKNGIINICVFLLLVFLDEYMAENKNFKIKNLFKGFIKMLKKWWKPISAAVFTFLCWSIYVRICNSANIDHYDAKILPDGLKTALSLKLTPSYVGRFLMNLLQALDQKLISGIVDITVYQFILICFGLLLISFYLEKKDIKLAFKSVVPYVISYIVFLLLTALSVFVMLSQYEAVQLASFGRYLNTYNFAFFVYILAFMARKEFLSSTISKVLAFSIWGVLILNIPFSRLTYFASDYSNRMKTMDFSYSMNEKFAQVNEYVPEDAMVFVLDQTDKDNIMAMWYARYYLFPRKVNASSVAITWKIKTEKNADDLRDWGLTAESFEKHLIDYRFDYLYLYTYDDLLLKAIDYMIEDDGDEEIETIYKIEKKDNRVKLIPIV